jgi:hypothetical protein
VNSGSASDHDQRALPSNGSSITDNISDTGQGLSPTRKLNSEVGIKQQSPKTFHVRYTKGVITRQTRPIQCLKNKRITVGPVPNPCNIVFVEQIDQLSKDPVILVTRPIENIG